jgi:hypothetical protein
MHDGQPQCRAVRGLSKGAILCFAEIYEQKRQVDKIILIEHRKREKKGRIYTYIRAYRKTWPILSNLSTEDLHA